MAMGTRLFARTIPRKSLGSGALGAEPLSWALVNKISGQASVKKHEPALLIRIQYPRNLTIVNSDEDPTKIASQFHGARIVPFYILV